MQSRITYTRTEYLRSSLATAYSKTVFPLVWVLQLFGLLLVLGGLWSFRSNDVLSAVMYLMIGLVAIVFPFIIRMKVRHFIRDSWQLQGENSEIIINMDDIGIQMTSSQYTFRVAWNKLTRVSDKCDFLFLFTGKVMVFALPKQFMSEEQVFFVLDKFVRK